jgi:hypothetical protein
MTWDSAFGLDDFGLDADESAPVVTDVSPAEGAAIARTAAVAFTVTDDIGLRRIVLVAKFSQGWEAVYDGGEFSPEYTRSSVQTLLSGRSYRFTLRRDAGWPEPPTITALAFDTSGNETA